MLADFHGPWRVPYTEFHSTVKFFKIIRKIFKILFQGEKAHSTAEGECATTLSEETFISLMKAAHSHNTLEIIK